jgi:hypothetical protein
LLFLSTRKAAENNFQQQFVKKRLHARLHLRNGKTFFLRYFEPESAAGGGGILKMKGLGWGTIGLNSFPAKAGKSFSIGVLLNCVYTILPGCAGLPSGKT